ncbi:hypothetical protein ACFX13_007744 [Malus domestica]
MVLGVIKGSIKSTRKNSDPLHFESWDLSSDSIPVVAPRRSIWRMNVEITLVLISTALACGFVVLQLFYLKKHLLSRGGSNYEPGWFRDHLKV